MGKAYFCDVGCGDCCVFQGAFNTLLIDCYGVDKNAHLLPSSKRLRGVFITHQHRDHYEGLNYLKDNGYSIDFLVYSPYERRYDDISVTYEEWAEFNSLRDYFVNRGTEPRTPYRQDDVSKVWWDAGDIKLRILGPFQDHCSSDTREIHDACLVVHATAGSRKFLVCGDASDCSLSKLAQSTTNYCNDVLRCSHHGSLNGAELEFVKNASARYTVISTACGVYENVPHPTALKRYEDHTSVRVYRTDNDGCITWTF